jgi:uncharacterized protein YdaU (DUF1376 family)
LNYYKRHLGDYARDTGHLSALEHGVYNLLLDWYYINERPIPAEKAVRIAKGNRTETETVLTEFFFLTDEGWRHNRADREISDYQARAETNRITGKLGGRPRKTETVSERKPNRNPNVTLATSHKPLASNQEKKKPSRSRAKTPLPDGFSISEAVKRWAVEKGHARLPEHLEAFKAKALANGYMYSNWDAAFMEAVRGNWAKLEAPTKQRSDLKSPEQALAPSETKEERDAAWRKQMKEYGANA